MKNLLLFISSFYVFTTVNAHVINPIAFESVCSINIVTASPILCNGDCNGSLTAIANGVPAFHYLWSTQDTTATINNLCAGVYSVVMTDSVGCIDSATVVVTEPTPILSTINANYLNCICIYNIIVNGGTSPYAYLWCDGSVGQQMVNCIQGVCIVNIVDANGCMIQDTIIMNPPPPLTIALFSDPATCVGCTDGTASTVPMGGAPPYTYQWSTGETTSSISGLGTGVYTVCVTDLNQCTVCDTISVAEDPTGIVSNIRNVQVKIYPNPFNEETVLEVNSEIRKSNPEFIISDVIGKIITSIRVEQLITTISRKSLAAGVYFYQLRETKKTITNGKLVIVD